MNWFKRLLALLIKQKETYKLKITFSDSRKPLKQTVGRYESLDKARTIFFGVMSRFKQEHAGTTAYIIISLFNPKDRVLMNYSHMIDEDKFMDLLSPATSKGGQ